jgi:hypothetical protein
MRGFRRFLVGCGAAIACLAACAVAAADVLYAASVRNHLGEAPQALAGNLYRIDSSAATFTLVAPLRVDRDIPIGVTGLADVPETNTLYGITASSSPNHPHSLVMVDAATGSASVVGDLGAAGTDIAFDPKGQLFVWLRETGQLGRIDLATGRATPIGPPGPATEVAGLAIDLKGRAYLAASGAEGSIDTVDLATGVVTKGPLLRGAPLGGINSLTLSPTGALLAVNTNLGRPANAVLVGIDASTGQVTQLGPLPNDTDALVFVEPPWNFREFLASHGLLLLAMAFLFGIGLAYLVMQEKRGGTAA